MVETVELREGISAHWNGKALTLSKSGKTNTKTLPWRKLAVEVKGNQLMLHPSDHGKKAKAVLNSVKAHIENMELGLEKDFEYRLSIVYAHFPMTVVKKERILEVNNFLGSKKPKKARIVGNAQVEIKGKEITVKGNNLEEVSQTAANLEQTTRVTNKDRRIFQDGIFIVKKGVHA